MAREGVYTTGQVAKTCGVATRTVAKWIDSGALEGWKIPGSQDRRVAASVLVDFMRANGFDEAMIPAASCPDRPRVVVVGMGEPDIPAPPGADVRYVASPFGAGVACAEHAPDVVVVEMGMGRLDAGMIARGAKVYVKKSVFCIAIAGDDDPLPSSFDAAIDPKLPPRGKSTRLASLLEGHMTPRPRRATSKKFAGHTALSHDAKGA